jgi:cell division protein ZapA
MKIGFFGKSIQNKTLILIMQELIPINIVIADRTYRIKTTPADEEAVRRTLKTINDKILEFKTQFAGKDMQDYISMVLIWYATLPAAGNLNQENEFAEALQKIEDQLNKAF